jgi:prophage regulatory protein
MLESRQVIGEEISANMRPTKRITSVLETGTDKSSEHPIHDTAPLIPRLLKRAIRRTELRQIVPLADTTIYEMEQRGEFPRRFNLTSRCVVWDLAEVEAWLEERRRASDPVSIRRTPSPDVRLRKRRPVRQ